MDNTGPSILENLAIQKSLKLTTVQLVGGIACYKCRLTFRDKKSYDKHYEEHREKEVKYMCVVCEKDFNSYPLFRSHCYNKHVSTDFKCDKCSKTFTKGAYLREHQLLHLSNKYKCIPSCGFEWGSNFKIKRRNSFTWTEQAYLFNCLNCKNYIRYHFKRCATREEFKLHKKTNNHLPPYPCQNCKVKLYDSIVCKSHIKQHAEVEYICPICSKHVLEKSHLLEHYENTSDVRIHILCVYCNLTFGDKNQFIEHSLDEHNYVVFGCPCKKRFDKYKEFAQHRCSYTVMFPSKRKINQTELCTVCYVKLKDMNACVVHMKTHVITKYLCMVCGEKCNSDYLVRHVHKHFPLHYHICSICEQAFDSLKNLRMHSKIHTKPPDLIYVCTLCNKNFILYENGQKHLKTVHHIRNNVVMNRDKEFIKMVPFDEVILLNGNNDEKVVEIGKVASTELPTDKKHKCNECNRFFNRPSKLRDHMNVHRGTQKYSCMICQKSFQLYRTYHKHLKVVHNTPPNKFKKLHKNCTSHKLSKNNNDKSDNNKEVPELCGSNNTKKILHSEGLLQDYLMYDSTLSENEQMIHSLGEHIFENEDFLKSKQTHSEINLDLNENLQCKPNILQANKFTECIENHSENYNTGVPPAAIHDFSNGTTSCQSAASPEQNAEMIYTGMNTIEIDGQVVSMDEEIPHIDPFLTINLTKDLVTNAHFTASNFDDIITTTWQEFITKNDFDFQCSDHTVDSKLDIMSTLHYDQC